MSKTIALLTILNLIYSAMSCQMDTIQLKRFYRNGILKAEGPAIKSNSGNEIPIGEWRYYYSNGKMRSHEDCHFNKDLSDYYVPFDSSWHKNGNIRLSSIADTLGNYERKSWRKDGSLSQLYRGNANYGEFKRYSKDHSVRSHQILIGIAHARLPVRYRRARNYHAAENLNPKLTLNNGSKHKTLRNKYFGLIYMKEDSLPTLAVLNGFRSDTLFMMKLKTVYRLNGHFDTTEALVVKYSDIDSLLLWHNGNRARSTNYEIILSVAVGAATILPIATIGMLLSTGIYASDFAFLGGLAGFSASGVFGAKALFQETPKVIRTKEWNVSLE